MNPWLKIPHTDYENHMIKVGQTQVLSEQMEFYLDKYQPENFALLGCATGNGLEHIQSGITKNVFAIDINPNYLQITNDKFKSKIENLDICCLDISKGKLNIQNVDLFFVGLVLEYVEPISALTKIRQTLNQTGVLVLLIQKNYHTTFVSKTEYKSLEQLSSISQEVDEKSIDEFIRSKNLELNSRREIMLTESKSFVVLEYVPQ